VPSSPSTPLVVGVLSANANSDLWQEEHDISLVLDKRLSANNNLPSSILSSLGKLSSGYSTFGSSRGILSRNLYSLVSTSGSITFSSEQEKRNSSSRTQYMSLIFNKFGCFYIAIEFTNSNQISSTNQIFKIYMITINCTQKEYSTINRHNTKV